MLTNLLVLIPERCEWASKGENKLGPFIPGHHPSSWEKAVDPKKTGTRCFSFTGANKFHRGNRRQMSKSSLEYFFPWNFRSLE